MSKRTLWNDLGISLTVDNNDDSGIHILLLDRGPNVVNPAMVAALNQALDILEKAEHPKALVVLGKRKFFSNGLDLDFLMSNESEQVYAMIESFWRVLARVLVLDCRTVAAINGHGFGAGLFLALACDYRIMRTERGYLNWPELNLGMRLAKGFSELTKAKVTDPKVLRDGVLTGKRYTSGEALQAGLIDAECDVKDLERRAGEMAVAGLAKNLKAKFFNPESFRQMKMELYTDAYRALTMAKADTPPQSRL